MALRVVPIPQNCNVSNHGVALMLQVLYASFYCDCTFFQLSFSDVGDDGRARGGARVGQER